MSEINKWKEKWQAALLEQHRHLFDYKTKSLKPEFAEYVNCPVCDSQTADFLFEKDWFRHVQCRMCKMVYMNPRMNKIATHSFYNSGANEIYNEAKFDAISTSTEMDAFINFQNLGLINRFRFPQKGTLLEIGSAKGFFLLKAREQGYMVYGLELNQRNFQYSHARLGDTILNNDLLDAHFDDGKFDVVYMRDVMEHIPAPLPFIKEVNRVTKPGGIVFIETHNIEGWIYKLAREHHTVIFGFEHPVHWSPRSLGRILECNGFVIREVKQASLDFTLQDILNYMINPSFTTIYPQVMNKTFTMLVKVLMLPLCLKPVRWLDKYILPNIANSFGRGSVMKVIARKVS